MIFTKSLQYFQFYSILLCKFIYNLVEGALKLSLCIRKKQDAAYSTLNVRLIFSLHSISFEWEIEDAPCSIRTIQEREQT